MKRFQIPDFKGEKRDFNAEFTEGRRGHREGSKMPG